LGGINKAATLNFKFFEHGSDVIEEESPYKPDPGLDWMRALSVHLLTQQRPFWKGVGTQVVWKCLRKLA